MVRSHGGGKAIRFEHMAGPPGRHGPRGGEHHGDYGTVQRTCLRAGEIRMVLPVRSKDPEKDGTLPPTLWMCKECRESDPQLVRMYDMENGSFGRGKVKVNWDEVLVADAEWIAKHRNPGSASQRRGYQATRGKYYAERGKEAA